MKKNKNTAEVKTTKTTDAKPTNRVDAKATKRKLIDINENDVIPLQILAAKAGKDLKNFIQDSLSELAQSAAQ